MGVRLDHVRIDCFDQEAVRDFLVRLLDLKAGWRPPFSQPGYWLYAAGDESAPARNEDPAATYPEGASAVIHLWPRTSPRGPGWIDHICFGPYDDADAKRAGLRALGVPFRESRLPGSEIVQFFVTGPEDIRIELQCRPRSAS